MYISNINFYIFNIDIKNIYEYVAFEETRKKTKKETKFGKESCLFRTF